MSAVEWQIGGSGPSGIHVLIGPPSTKSFVHALYYGGESEQMTESGAKYCSLSCGGELVARARGWAP